jgi:NTE family protein
MKKIGLALGSGSARGFSHIGIIEALADLGIHPDIVCGASMGAIIGAAYCSNTLEHFNSWARRLDRSKIIRYFDINWLGRGGPVKGEHLLEFLQNHIPDQPISELSLPFGAVATDLNSGETVFLREGSLLNAVRASSAVPGILPPWPRHLADGSTQWLVDGGLVDPVPVALCREMGADIVIGVNLNEYLVKTPPDSEGETEDGRQVREKTAVSLLEKIPLVEKLPDVLPLPLKSGVQGLLSEGGREPSYFTVVANSIKIMQYQIAHIRLQENPPDILLTPRLENINLLAFDRAIEIIEEGKATVARARDQLNICLN